MNVTINQTRVVPLHPVHAVLLAASFPLFLGTLLSDWAYGATYEVQWTHFASWLIVGALVFSGLALLWSVVALFQVGGRGKRKLLTFLLLLGVWIFGFINALVHTKDAWAVMPEAPILSAIVLVLAIAAIWSGFSSGRSGHRK